MSDDRLLELAKAAGLMPTWEDAFKRTQDVAPETLRRVLAALDLPAAGDGEIADSLAQLRQDRRENLPPLVTALAGAPITLPIAPDRFEIVLEDGARRAGTAEAQEGRAVLPAIETPGYHRLVIGEQEATLAVAPAACFGLADIAPGRRLWGLSAQLYGLRREGDGGIGDFAALRDLVRAAAARGAAALAVSPVHAQFSADCDRFSPYSPSSRVMLNALHADAADASDAASLALEAAPLVAWPQAARTKLARLRRAFDARPDRAGLDRFRAAHGEAVERHARFETLHAHIWSNDPARWHWRDWPEPYRDPDTKAVADFAAAHADDVAFHAWLQMRAEAGLDEAQAAARRAGMPIGLIADLAVGSDGGGSHCWSRQEETLLGLVVGAPPDLLSREGQNWGLTVFSPRGLRACGFRAFLEMLRASLRHAGGVRIDHVMGLMRLWVIPDGGAAADGVYLRFPFEDFLRLVALESNRQRAIVLGEDLGTVPEGFRERLRDARVMGMRVMWFEREDDESFRAPARWSPEAVAMTSTHDLPTVAGWWSGRDLEWRSSLGLMRDEAEERADRTRDRGLLWDAFRASGAALDDAPPPEQGQHAAGSAAGHVGRAACALALLPLEDALAQEEQPNLPGTLHEHPNWQRRIPVAAHAVLDDPAVAGRLAALDRARGE